MPTPKAWLTAFRLRTLPLSLSSIILGSLLAAADGGFLWPVAVLAVATTLILQVLSNLANDYGDAASGVDNAARSGPARSIQSGEISTAQMKRAIGVFVALALVSGVALVAIGTHRLVSGYLVLFLLLGVGAIAAAIRYTVGSKPYGYRGLGDLFVFLFFGIAGVCGTYFLHTNHWRWDLLLPAASVGLLSVAVLNLNNMRDIDNDAASGKRTLVVLMGPRRARFYHAAITSIAILAAAVFVAINYHSAWQWLFLVVVPLLLLNNIRVQRTTEAHLLDPELKKVALTTLLFALTFGIGALC